MSGRALPLGCRDTRVPRKEQNVTSNRWRRSAGVWWCCAVTAAAAPPPSTAYDWYPAEVLPTGIFSCAPGYRYLQVEQLHTTDQGHVRYDVRSEGGAQRGVLNPEAPQPHERGLVGVLRGMSHAPLAQPVAIACVRADPEDPLFVFGVSSPYRWKPRPPGDAPCDGGDGLVHWLVIEDVVREDSGQLRFSVRGQATRLQGRLDPAHPRYPQVRLLDLLQAHAGSLVPVEGIGVCVNAPNEDPLVDLG